MNVQWYGAKNDGLVGSAAANDIAFAAAAAAAELSGRGLYWPAAGAYYFSVGLVFARSHVELYGDPGTVLRFTGAGVAFSVDGGPAAFLLNVNIENLTIIGNAAATTGLYLRSVHHSTVRNVRVADVSGDALLWEFGVANILENFRCSSNEGAFAVIPSKGINITRRGGAGDYSTTLTIINPIVEGLVGGTGIYFDYAYGCSVIGGTSEANDAGIVMTGVGGKHYVQALWTEANATVDIQCDAFDCTFVDVHSSLQWNWGAGSYGNLAVGGFAVNVANASAFAQRYDGLMLSGTGVFADALSSGSYFVQTTLAWTHRIPGLPVFADNVAATGGGLVAGDQYRTAAGVMMVVF